ncbi:MAG TPA: PfkB family carbohydrate kinase [Solirubrobacteraceae bacterium]|nr:PfkB family carbohydrate kinase [Solirubrobacteraceae bacterium]
MTDVAVLLTPFLDLTFAGLDELPPLGGERFATDLIRSPGGGAITATGAARLGLDTVLAVPLGEDPSGLFLAKALRADGVRLVAPHDGLTATTVVMPAHCDRALVTYDPGARVRRSDVEELAPRAVVCGVDQLDGLPAGTVAYVSVGDQEAHEYARRLPATIAGHTLVVNEPEALLLAGAADAEQAAFALAEKTAAVVVTVGPRGAIGVADGELHVAAGVDAGAAVDTTGAGDLFMAAYVWAGLRGMQTADRLRWAVLYASLSVTVPTATAGAITESQLIDEAARRGLRAGPTPSPAKER